MQIKVGFIGESFQTVFPHIKEHTPETMSQRVDVFGGQSGDRDRQNPLIGKPEVPAPNLGVVEAEAAPAHPSTAPSPQFVPATGSHSY